MPELPEYIKDLIGGNIDAGYRQTEPWQLHTES